MPGRTSTRRRLTVGSKRTSITAQPLRTSARCSWWVGKWRRHGGLLGRRSSLLVGGVFRTRTPRRRRPQAGARGSQLIAAESKKKVISHFWPVEFGLHVARAVTHRPPHSNPKLKSSCGSLCGTGNRGKAAAISRRGIRVIWKSEWRNRFVRAGSSTGAHSVGRDR